MNKKLLDPGMPADKQLEVYDLLIGANKDGFLANPVDSKIIKDFHRHRSVKNKNGVKFALSFPLLDDETAKEHFPGIKSFQGDSFLEKLVKLMIVFRLLNQGMLPEGYLDSPTSISNVY